MAREEPCCSPGTTAANCKVAAPSAIWEQIVAACTGAAVTSMLMTPMDVVKIRLQQQHHPFPKGSCFFYHNGLMEHLCTSCGSKQPCEWYQRPGNFKGTVDAILKITKFEGIRSLWSGLAPTLVMAIPATVFYFSLYDNLLVRIKKAPTQTENHSFDRFIFNEAVFRVGSILKLCKQRASNGKWRDFPEWAAAPISGATARTTAVTIVSPLEMIRTKMQSERMSYSELGKAVRTSFASQGVRSFYIGWGPTVLRDIPFSALYWGSYDALKNKVMRYLQKDRTTFSISFGCGAASGMMAAFVTTPFDVVKTHRQIQLGKANPRKLSTIEALTEIYKQRGAGGLFSGVIPRVVKVAPACAIMIGSYEFFKLYFEKRRNIKTNS